MTVASLCVDLDDEQKSLDDLVAPLDATAWEQPTPAEGWTIRDQISHLANGAQDAWLAVSDPGAFQERASLTAEERHAAVLGRGRSMPASAVLEWWRNARRAFSEACTSLDPRARIAWYGPSMSVRSFVTARIMETWAHGQDVADALHVARPVTARLRHVAHLGVRARPWNYTSRGRTRPAADVRVEVLGPNAALWTWGDADAPDRITGSAHDFCLVVTRRRHVDDTALVVEGDRAREWMEIAQAYAGPPGQGRRPGQFAAQRAATSGRSK